MKAGQPSFILFKLKIKSDVHFARLLYPCSFFLSLRLGEIFQEPSPPDRFLDIPWQKAPQFYNII